MVIRIEFYDQQTIDAIRGAAEHYGMSTDVYIAAVAGVHAQETMTKARERDRKRGCGDACLRR